MFAYVNDTPSSGTFPFLKHKGTVITELILGRPKWTSTHLLSSVSPSLHSFCSHDSSSGRTEHAVKFYWWAWYEAQIPCKDEYINCVALFIVSASCLRARSGCYSMAIIGVINAIFLTQQWDCTASLETKRKEEEKKNQQAWRGGKTRISGQQHPRSLVGRQTVMLKFRSHTLLQTMLSLGRRRMRDSGGGKNRKRGGREGDRNWACTA